MVKITAQPCLSYNLYEHKYSMYMPHAVEDSFEFLPSPKSPLNIWNAIQKKKPKSCHFVIIGWDTVVYFEVQ